MKLAALAFILLFSSNIYMVAGQELSKQLDEATKLKMEKLRKLEGELDELQSISSAGTTAVEFKVKGNDAASLTLHITATSTSRSATSNKLMKRTVLDVKLKNDEIPAEYIDEIMKRVLLRRAKCGELDSVRIEQIDTTNNYVVTKDYSYGPPHVNYTITAFEGTVYDRASIPPIVWFITKDMLGNVAPLFHDLLYRYGGVLPARNISPYKRFSRKEADLLFDELMKKCGVGFAPRNSAYVAVRAASKYAWKKPKN